MEVDSARPTADLDRADTTERPDTDHDVASVSDERSVAASQTSTLDTAASSQMNSHSDPKESSQSSLDQYDSAAAPMELDAPKTNGAHVNGVVSEASQLPAIDTNVAGGKAINGATNGHPVDLKYGQKRTASGTVKDPRSHTTNGSNTGMPSAHKRNASTNTQVNELSAQLRARLSYAMLKVQNGWETRTLEEVEALAAQQQGSPMSVSSPWRGSGSPNGQGIAPNMPVPTSAATMHASNVLNGSIGANHTSSGVSRAPNHSASLSTSSIPPLAPPVDLRAGVNARRTAGHDRPPPHLTNGNGAHRNSTTSSMGSMHSGTLIPATPPLEETSSNMMQTPSQRATASERDAIETLLFMSSPGNSQNFRNSTPQMRPLSQSVHQSPQRPALSASPQRNRPLSAKQVSFLPVIPAGVHPVDRVPLSPRKKGILDNANLETDAGIDHVLDQMPLDADGESSSDESLGSVQARSEVARPSLSV